MADDVLDVCAQEGVTRAIFAGVSVGSGMALLIGLEQPEMVEAAILVGGSSGGANDVAGRINGYLTGLPEYHLTHMTELFAPGFLETTTGRWVKKLFTDTSKNLSGRCIGEIFTARAGCDMSARLYTMKPPTLVINGEFDGSLKAGRLTASLIPGAEHYVLPGTGHACCIEDPATFDARMIQFLSDNSL
jgi:3-oxoadipate enol-lactonase